MSFQSEHSQSDAHDSLCRLSEQPRNPLETQTAHNVHNAGLEKTFGVNEAEDLAPESNVRKTSGPRSEITVCVSSVHSIHASDGDSYMSEVMVVIAGELTWLGTALLDTGEQPSFINETIARRAQELGLTTIQYGSCGFYEGIVKGHELEAIGRVELKFSLDDVSYKHPFLVVEPDERFEVLLGCKFIKRAGLLYEKKADVSDP